MRRACSRCGQTLFGWVAGCTSLRCPSCRRPVVCQPVSAHPHSATNIVVLFALGAFPLASSAAATSSSAPAPAPSARTTPRRSHTWRRTRLGLDCLRRAHSAAPSSATTHCDWWRRRQLVACYVVLQNLGSLGLERCASGRMTAGSALESLEDRSGRCRELGEIRPCRGAAVCWEGGHLGRPCGRIRLRSTGSVARRVGEAIASSRGVVGGYWCAHVEGTRSATRDTQVEMQQLQWETLRASKWQLIISRARRKRMHPSGPVLPRLVHRTSSTVLHRFS
jgi:hypothetical protein